MYDKESRERLAKEALRGASAAMPHSYRGHDVTPWCCEIVLGALQTITPLKISRLDEITFGLGAGFSLQGEVCGAVSAHIIAIGLDVVSRIRETARIRLEVSTETRAFCDRFRENFGSIRCKDLIGYSLSEPAQMKAYLEDKEKCRLCDSMIAFAIIDPLPFERQGFKKDILGL